MLSYSNYSQNYSGIIDGSLPMIGLWLISQSSGNCKVDDIFGGTFVDKFN